MSIVVEKTTQAELGRIAEKEGESVSAVGARMINAGLKAYKRREKVDG